MYQQNCCCIQPMPHKVMLRKAKAKSIYSAKIEYGEELADAIIPNLDPVQDIIQENEEDQYVHLMIWTRYKDKEELKLR